MAGSIPRTGYLLTRLGTVFGEFDSLYAIAIYIGISVDDNRQIVFDGERVLPTYSGEWSGDCEIMKDWANHHMMMKLSCEYKIYRYLRSL